MNKIKSLIFDFDGVIAESVSIKSEAFAEIYSRYGEQVVEKVINHHEANGGVSRFEKFKKYHKDFLGIDLDDIDIKMLAKDFSDLVVKKVIEAPLVKGAYDFLSNNYSKYDFFISSGTPENEIKHIIKKKNLSIFFKEVYGSPEKKYDHILKIMKKYSYHNNEVIFIGDAPSDMEAATNHNIYFISRISNTINKLNSPYSVEDLTELEPCIDKIISGEIVS